MSKKRAKEADTGDETKKQREKTTLDGNDVEDLAVGVEIVLNRLRMIGQNMRDRGLTVSVKGIPTWQPTIKRLNATSQSIENAWLEVSSLKRKVAEKREKFESGSE